MSDQDNGQVSTLQRPTTDEPEVWKAYWKAKGWLWRTEPEIDVERQKYLAERRTIVPDFEKDVYPFKDIKLSRADVEWLLTISENQPTRQSNGQPQKHKRFNLMFANLRKVNLRNLPLQEISLGGAHLEETQLNGVHLENASLYGVYLENAILSGAYLQNARLCDAHLEGANLGSVHLQRANLEKAHLEGANLYKADLKGCNLRGAFFNSATHLTSSSFDFTLLAGLRWGDVDLSVVDWTRVKVLGDEQIAQQKIDNKGVRKNKQTRLNEYRDATRASQQFAIILRSQGLTEDASRFAYRAQKLQRIVLRRQKKFGQYLFSLFLDALAGYGYRPGRSVIWYLVTIFGFALAYFTVGHLSFWPDAIVYSLTSFHGRGFLPSLDGQIVTLHYPLVVMAAFEAVVGLLIEISFIATFTQRFFGR